MDKKRLDDKTTTDVYEISRYHKDVRQGRTKTVKQNSINRAYQTDLR